MTSYRDGVADIRLMRIHVPTSRLGRGKQTTCFKTVLILMCDFEAHRGRDVAVVSRDVVLETMRV